MSKVYKVILLFYRMPLFIIIPILHSSISPKFHFVARWLPAIYFCFYIIRYCWF